MSAKQAAVAHILTVARGTRKGANPKVHGGFVELLTGDTMAIMVTNRGEVKMVRHGIWKQRYPSTELQVKDLRWGELGILLERCAEMGAPFH